jgi:hypothetical protein
MLSFLRARLPGSLSPAPLLLAAEISNFRLHMLFPLIIVPCNTWSTLSAVQRAQALRCIRDHLRPGGLFAASMPPGLMSLPARSDRSSKSTSIQKMEAWCRSAAAGAGVNAISP